MTFGIRAIPIRSIIIGGNPTPIKFHSSLPTLSQFCPGLIPPGHIPPGQIPLGQIPLAQIPLAQIPLGQIPPG